MRKYIRKLQSKPEHIRKQILVGSLVVSMSFVSLIWIASLGYNFTKEKVVKTEDVIKPFALFKQTISETINDVGASVGDISKTLKERQAEEDLTPEVQVDLTPVETQ